MNIGSAAAQSGLPPKTIRYYEDISLLVPMRAANGYRDYTPEDIHCLAFLGRARKLGFTVEECRQLLSLYLDKDRASSEVKSLAMHKIADIDTRLVELKAMKEMLSNLAAHCHGDNRPECPILDGLTHTPNT